MDTHLQKQPTATSGLFSVTQQYRHEQFLHSGVIEAIGGKRLYVIRHCGLRAAISAGGKRSREARGDVRAKLGRLKGGSPYVNTRRKVLGRGTYDAQVLV